MGTEKPHGVSNGCNECGGALLLVELDSIVIKLEKTGGKCNERACNFVRYEQEPAHNVTYFGSVAFEI